MSDEEEHSESEFYNPDEYEFLDNGELTETNNERVGEIENEGNSQEEFETFVKEKKKSENTTKKTFSDIKTFQRCTYRLMTWIIYWQSFSRTSQN